MVKTAIPPVVPTGSDVWFVDDVQDLGYVRFDDVVQCANEELFVDDVWFA